MTNAHHEPATTHSLPARLRHSLNVSEPCIALVPKSYPNPKPAGRSLELDLFGLPAAGLRCRPGLVAPDWGAGWVYVEGLEAQQLGWL